MTDRNGIDVDVGTRVRFSQPGEPGASLVGTIRSVRMVGETYEAWVDDGDPAVSDPRRNRLTVRRKVFSEDIEVHVEPPVTDPVVEGTAWEQVGVIGVDAGLVWLGDPCYILHTRKPKAIGKSWGDLARKLDRGTDTQQMSHDKGHPGLGVVVTSGFGDGTYPVEVRRLADGTVAEVRVVFVRETAGG